MCESLSFHDIYMMFMLTYMTHAWQMWVCASLALYDIHMFILTDMTCLADVCMQA